jgi:hypothetical protein
MPKKIKPESQAEQSARFLAEAGKLIAAGELNPIEAEEALDSILHSQKTLVVRTNPENIDLDSDN